MAIKTYAVVGTGGRGSGMFALPLAKEFPAAARLAAVCDANPVRAAYCVSRLPRPVPVFTDFAAMMREVNPDGLAIATRDNTHAQYVIAGLKAGKRVYSEKPLCTTAGQCRAILAAAKQSRGQCFVTHNMRYAAAVEQIRDIIRDGTLGTVSFMQFDETLDRCHGADYFRRWHRQFANTGGLLIHKASHHFDILNWWAGARPAEVRAHGQLAFYGKNGSFRGQRCLGCAHARKCPFYADMFTHDVYRNMYRNAEGEDGYIRDGCVFDPAIDICDQMGVLIRYANGIDVSYTLNAFSPYESLRCAIEGSKGRLEYVVNYGTGWTVGGQRLPGVEQHQGETLRLCLPGKGIRELAIRKQKGGHGGADPRLRAEFFGQDWRRKPSEQMASLEEAVQAVLVGVAANSAIATGRTVDVQRLLRAPGARS
jgi:predicted dehydrogenase